MGQSSTQPPPPTTHEEDDPIPPQPIEDQVQDLTMRLDALWDETQEHHVSMSQEMDNLTSKMNTVLSNQEIIKRQPAQVLSVSPRIPLVEILMITNQSY